MFAHHTGFANYGVPAPFDPRNPSFSEELSNLFQGGRMRPLAGLMDFREPRSRHLLGVLGSIHNDYSLQGCSNASQGLLERLFTLDSYRRAGGLGGSFDPYRDPALQLIRLLQPRNAGCAPRTFSAMESAVIPRLSEVLRDPIRAAYHLAAVDAIGRPMDNIFGSLRKYPNDVRRMVDDCPCVFWWLRPESRRALHGITGPIDRSALRCMHTGSSSSTRRIQCLHDYRDILPEFRMRLLHRCSCCGRRSKFGDEYDSEDGHDLRYAHDDDLFDSEDEWCLGRGDCIALERRTPLRVPRRAHGYHNIGHF